MYSAISHSHSGFRYILLLAIVSLIIHAFTQFSAKSYSNKLHKHAKITAYIFYFNVVLGIILYFISEKVLIGPLAMKETVYRFFTLEHPVMILLSLTVLKIGGYRAAKRNNAKSAKILAYSTLIALLLLIAGIPWPFREALAAGWF